MGMVMPHLITVAPLGDGWTLRSDALENDMAFQSGTQAEAAAKALAQRLNAAGLAVTLEVRLRDGSVGGRFACPPAELASRQFAAA
jgi:hypothetical protein